MHETFTEIGFINQLAETFLRRVLPKPLTIAQFHVLTHLMRVSGPHTPTQITKAFQVTKGAMTHTLGLLSKNGWVSIEMDVNDGRSKQVKITQDGIAIFKDTIAKLAPHYEHLSTALERSEIDAAKQTLTKIRIFMDENRDLKVK